MWIASCKKESDNNVVEYSETQKFLMNGNWKFTGNFYVNGQLGNYILPDCRNDDHIDFTDGDSFTRDLGEMICEFDTFFDPPVGKFHWYLTDNETTLIMQSVFDDYDTSTLIKVDEHTFYTRYLQPDGTTVFDWEYTNY